MFQLKIDPQFAADYKKFKRRHPELVNDLRDALTELTAHGKLPDSYRPHMLSHPDGNYNGHIDFHLSEGKVDVIVLYLPHASNPIIRLVRIGEHRELFHGPVK